MPGLLQRHRARQPFPELRAQHPLFKEAVFEDARMSAAFRGERHEFRSDLDRIGQAIRLAWVSDAFLGQVLYRGKAAMQRRGVPVLPRICHRMAMMHSQICIGDPVVIGPGLYLPHGQVVIDGLTSLGRAVTVRPWVTIGLKEGDFRGPTVGDNVQIGTGAKLVGPVTIGRGSLIGANAVVTKDVPPHSVAAGVPARVTRDTRAARPPA